MEKGPTLHTDRKKGFTPLGETQKELLTLKGAGKMKVPVRPRKERGEGN